MRERVEWLVTRRRRRGTGSISVDRETGVVRARLPARLDPTRRAREFSPGHLAKAEAWLDQQIAAILNPAPVPETGNVVVGEWIDTWYATWVAPRRAARGAAPVAAPGAGRGAGRGACRRTRFRATLGSGNGASKRRLTTVCLIATRPSS